MTDKKNAAEEKGRSIDTELVETLGEIATRLDLSEIEVERGDLKIRVARQISIAPMPIAMPAAPLAPPPPVAAPRPSPLASSPAEAVVHPGTVTSPMVGTAYLRPSPQAALFVEIGGQVKAGDTVLLIEAMKTFNEITAPRAGTVTAVLVEDAQPVEFGQPLIVIE